MGVIMSNVPLAPPIDPVCLLNSGLVNLPYFRRYSTAAL